jgi:hypothetical protein
MSAARWILALWLGGSAHQAMADAGYFTVDDTVLRNDLLLLNDAGVIRLPVGQWPLPRGVVRDALTDAKDFLITNAAVDAALARVRVRLEVPQGVSIAAFASAGERGTWREFDTPARDRGDAGVSLRGDNARFSVELDARVAFDASDSQELRLDGSHATVRAGNWLLSAHALDRWWGPGRQGNFILSNNARPMPTLMLERATARPFDNRWLRWVGPWRLSLGFGRMEGEREDVDAPLFMSWRISIMPLKDVELGFSRTAQFCGEGQKCDLDVLGNLLAGNDNVGIDATPEDEPGNQMAGFDLRWASPLGDLPYAIYSQAIGEDESGYLPAKYLMQYGLEAWKPLSEGALLLGYLEYASTTCSANSSHGPYYNCAYNTGRFDAEGYRYRGRVIGYPSDRDAENYAVGGSYTTGSGELWSVVVRRSRFNRDDVGDATNSVSSVPADYHAVEAGWQGSMHGASLAIDLGIERIDPVTGRRRVRPYGYIGWRYNFHR